MTSQPSIIEQLEALQAQSKTMEHVPTSDQTERASTAERRPSPTPTPTPTPDQNEQDAESGSDNESEYTYETDIMEFDPEKEWQDIVTQFNSLVFLIVIPIVGRILGRRFAHQIWAKLADRIF